MADNTGFGDARRNKKDEFYTQLDDISVELYNYRELFKDKTILCNCDDPYESNFFKFFALKFKEYGLKKLICTCWNGSPITGTELDLFEEKLDDKGRSRVAYKAELIDIPDLNQDGAVDLQDARLLLKQHKPEILKGNGDFRSEECVELLKEADIVVTNPPFSLFREFVALLEQYHKKYLIIGNINNITYKEIFPLIKDNKLWLGPSITSGDRKFHVPDDYDLEASNCGIDKNGRKYIRVKGIRWFTNLEHKKRHEKLELFRKYTPQKYPKYDNYDAINVDHTADIPEDYDGVMGVPITFLDKYCPEQFEIVSFRKGADGKDLVFTREREREFNRAFVSLFDEYTWTDKECRGKNQWEDYLRSYHYQKIENPTLEPVDIVYPLSTNLKNGLVNDCTINGHKTYIRVLIQAKHH